MWAEGPDSVDSRAGMEILSGMCGDEAMTRCSITCMDPGCHTRIFYDSEMDTEVPLYCERHRTESGRHSQVRSLVKEVEPEPVKMIELICCRRKCRNKQIISVSNWMSPTSCKACGSKMVFHKEVVQ
jgi:hypothetical protein